MAAYPAIDREGYRRHRAEITCRQEEKAAQIIRYGAMAVWNGRLHRGGLAAEGVVAEGEALAEAVGVAEGLAVGVILEGHRIARGAGEGLHGVVEIGAIGGGVIIVRGRIDLALYCQRGVEAYQVVVGIGITESTPTPVGDAGDVLIAVVVMEGHGVKGSDPFLLLLFYRPLLPFYPFTRPRSYEN